MFSPGIMVCGNWQVGVMKVARLNAELLGWSEIKEPGRGVVRTVQVCLWKLIFLNLEPPTFKSLYELPVF